MQKQLPAYVPILDAADRYDFLLEVLHHAVDVGIIDGIVVEDEILILEEDVQRLRQQRQNDDIELPQYLVLEEAARKHDLPQRALQHALETGLVRGGTIDGKLIVVEEDTRVLSDKYGDAPVDLREFITVSQIVEDHEIHEELLHEYIEQGSNVYAVQIDGELAVSEKDVKQWMAEQVIVVKREDFAHLRGKGLGIAEAAHKYEISQPTVSRWVKLGYIQKLGKDGRKILIDEADVAYCARIYQLQGGRQGKRIFDDQGNPYQLKYPGRAEDPTPSIVVE